MSSKYKYKAVTTRAFSYKIKKRRRYNYLRVFLNYPLRHDNKCAHQSNHIFYLLGKLFMKLKTISILAGSLLGIIGATSSFANGPQYQVTVTNITKGQSFTPILTVAHTSPVSLFTLGPVHTKC